MRAGGRVTQLAWAPGGGRLLAVTATGIRVLGPDGRTHRTAGAPDTARIGSAAWLPDGRAFAVVRQTAETGEVVLVRGGRERVLLALPARLGDVRASPDGRWLLLAAPDAGQWLLVRTSGSAHLTALSRVGRQFDPGGRGAAPLPRVEGWIP
jgi:dipeptidyl aminopeptidase/acylaminoacyl peptidase